MATTPISSPAIKSNPHPYAIKTTSTGILTRSNSTSSSNTTSHHFVPPSPTKRNSIHDSPARRPPSTHKYSRSLNSNELPRPLPIPPNFPSSSSSSSVSSPAASPTTAEFDSQVHQDAVAAGYIVSRRDRRAGTLPSVSQPDLISGGGGGVGGGGERAASADDLPDDPRLWTPSQLSTYLASSLRVTSGDVSPLVVQDMAAFVRAQKINGRKFLRLNEGDLDKYGLNQRWQNALLSASRTLRQDSLRGRIWTSPYPSTEQADLEDQDNDNENYSSTSSISSSGSMSELHRGRPGNQSGRVRGMVASFERRGPSRSVSPTKDAAAGSSVSGRRSISPAKPTTTTNNNKPDFGSFGFGSVRTRPRPQSDIFPSRSSFVSSYNNDNNGNDGAMVATSPETVGGEPKKAEPRLLPFPPPQHTSPQPDPNANLVSSFGPYALPQHHDTGSFLPSGILPFSPQSTGNTILTTASSPDPMGSLMSTQLQPIYVPQSGVPQQQQQQPFDVFDGDDENHQHFQNYHEQGVRPLPLPPHPAQQYYQQSPPLGSVQGFAGTTTGSMVDASKTGSTGGGGALIYSPHGQQQQSLSPHPQQRHPQQRQQQGIPIPTSHVQVQIQEEAPALVPDPTSFLSSSSFPSYHHHHQQQQPQPQPQHLPLPHESQLLQQPVHTIHAPQPRPGHGQGQGRDSPTKILEEKLEELLEPRPRSRVIPTQPGSHSHSHSRPRSRVPSMNLTLTPSTGVGVRVGGDEKRANGNLGISGTSEQQNNNNTPNLNATPTAPSSSHHNPRTRVISLSHARSHHRLSGVEVWGESHRHMSVAPSDDDDPDGSNEEDAEVKELEGEEEVGIGIEAVLEKDVPAVVVVIPEESEALDTAPTGTGGGGGGHGRDASGGSISSTLSSRTGSLREPKSAVITLVDVGHHHRRSSSSIGRVRKSDALPTPPASSSLVGREEEEEQSIEALLAKAGFGDGSGSVGARGGGGGAKERKRMPMNGAEAWEMMGYVDTVKHVDGVEPGSGVGESGSGSGSGGLSRSIEDIFSPVPAPVLSSNQTESSPPPQTKLKPKDQLKSEDTEKERELEKNIGETRRMVEEIRYRLDKVEQWISVTERSRQYQQQGGAGKRRGTATNGNVWPVYVMRKVLSASRIPGMLGLSAWLGSSASTPASSSTSTSIPASGPTSSSSPSPSTSTQTRSRNPTSTRSTLILRFAKLGLSLSTYAVLFGIGVCVVMLRMLGKRPGGAIFARLGARGGGIVNRNGVPGR